MKINITGRTDEVSIGMKRRAEEKVSKLLRFYERITWVDVTLDSDKDRHTAEISAGLTRGATVTGKAESDAMYGAIDQAVDKVARQLRKHKAKLTDRRTRRGDAPQADTMGE